MTQGQAVPSPHRAAVALSLRDVRLSIEGRPVLNGVSLEADEQRIGIVGRNGSGKTTLARVMAGLVAPDAGEIRVMGADVGRDRKAALRSIGILFQNPDHQIIFPTVEEEMAFGLRQMGQDSETAARRVAAILGRFGKAHWKDAHVQALSQGQKQLLCLMSVLAMEPQVIVLDEPFSGLDIPTRMQLERYLGQVAARLVHISHDPGLLAGYDRVVWIDAGAVRHDGAAVDVLPAFGAAMAEMGGGDDLSDLTG